MTTPDPYPAEGGCDCREVRYRMLTRPLFVHCCHCRWCQRKSSASFALNAMIESDRVTSLGAEYYDRDAFWPTDSLQRREALLPAIEAYQATLQGDA